MNVKNFHITVSFLGDLRPDQIEQAKKALAAAEEEADETSDNPI